MPCRLSSTATTSSSRTLCTDYRCEHNLDGPLDHLHFYSAQNCITQDAVIIHGGRYQRDQLNFSQNQQANYLTFAGVKIIIGGLLGKPLMGAFGQLGLTTFSNAINFCAQVSA